MKVFFPSMSLFLRKYLSVFFLISCFFRFPATAQWSTNSNINTAISIAAGGDYKSEPKIISDGAGGAIIVWYDYRNGIFNADIYAQRINAAGVVQWTANGVAISNAANDQYLPTLVSDGAGGAIIAWQDYRNSTGNPDVYAQRINASGTVLWTTNGVVVTAAPNEQFSPSMIPDGAGGAILTWQDARNPSNPDIYAQRINASGAVQWATDGVAIVTATDSQWPAIATDGANGAIITWQDFRSGTNSDIYGQRIDANGSVQWIANGVALCTATNEQYSPTIVSDASGGAIVTWQDFRGGLTDIYAQRVNGGGALQWAINGLAICTASDYQYSPIIASDGAQGAIICWYDVRSGNQDIYAQRINAAGVVQWTGNGVALVTTPETQTNPSIIADGAGGAIIAWQDQRPSSNNDIYAQRINAAGAIQWPNNGVGIGTSTAREELKPRLVSDGANGAIITWYAFDIPNYAKSDIFAQKVYANGTLDNGGSPCPSFVSLSNPGDNYSSGTIVKQAAASGGKVEATNLITGNANVTYEAASVELKPGFQAVNGVVFKAQVGGCN